MGGDSSAGHGASLAVSPNGKLLAAAARTSSASKVAFSGREPSECMSGCACLQIDSLTLVVWTPLDAPLDMHVHEQSDILTRTGCNGQCLDEEFADRKHVM